MASSVAGMLEKLSPMQMMQENGLQRATLALDLLQKKAADGGFASEIAQTSGGIHVLLQTALLHPEPKLRLAACAVLCACVKDGDSSFLKEAVERRLPYALLRILGEEDRRAQPEGGGVAIDPDLPVRRTAVEALAIVFASAEAPKALEENPYAPASILAACGSTDSIVRSGAVSIALALARNIERLPLVVAAAEEEPAMTAAALLDCACEESGDCPKSARALLLVLRSSDVLRKELEQLKAAERLAEVTNSSGSCSSATEVDAESSQMLGELAAWLGSDSGAAATST